MYDNCDTNLFVRQSTIEMDWEEVKYGDLRDNDNTSDFVEGCGQQGIKQQALLVRYHPCVSGIGNYCLFHVVQNKLM